MRSALRGSVRVSALAALVVLASACRLERSKGGQPESAAASNAAIGSSMAPPPSTALAAATSEGERTALEALPKGEGHDLILGNCLTCHGVAIIAQQHKDSAGWTKTVSQMAGWGAPLSKEDQPVLVRYLIQNYPARGVRSQ
jgi:cytochrome c5